MNLWFPLRERRRLPPENVEEPMVPDPALTALCGQPLEGPGKPEHSVKAGQDHEFGRGRVFQVEVAGSRRTERVGDESDGRVFRWSSAGSAPQPGTSSSLPRLHW